MIVGIDEVGRGPWAGPLVVGAVVLGDVHIDGLTDSKKLTKRRREQLSAEILQHSAAFGLGWVMADELDEIGLSSSLVLATKRALEEIRVPYHEIIIDGTINFLQDTGKGKYVTTMKKADLLIGAVSAASIIAKVARDDYMEGLDARYPGYGFMSHVGYGTAKHRDAIERLGVTPEHRHSFAPVAMLAGVRPVAPDRQGSIGKANKNIGDDAEDVAAEWLVVDGYEILERNWRTKFCEIDIIAQKAGALYFVEVKHRLNGSHGGGIAAINDRKLRQMTFAARIYLSNERRRYVDAQLAVMTTSGSEPTFEELLLLD